MTLIRVLAFAAAALSVAVTASAQSPNVGASLFGDIVRSTHTGTAGGSGAASGGEALGFALRAGTRLGTAWGVELEFARPASMEMEGASGVPILALPSLTFTSLEPLLTLERVPGSGTVIFPPIIAGFRSSQRHTTLSAVAWAEQQLSARVALRYLGGIGFVRSQHEFSVSYSPLVGASPATFLPYASETTRYGVGALAGFEGRLALTDRAQLVPGVRLHASDHTWLVRPSVGIAWSF
jgi:hypothetical protein